MKQKPFLWIFVIVLLSVSALAVDEAQIYTGTGSNGLTSAGYNSAIATAYQCFVANHTYNMTKLMMGLRYQGGQTSGTVTLWIYNGAASKPTTAIAKSITNLSGSSVTSSFANYSFNFTPSVTLTNNSNYCFVLNSSTLNTGAYYNLESAGAGSGIYGVGYGDPTATSWTIAGSDVMPYLTTYKEPSGGGAATTISFISPTPNTNTIYHVTSQNYLNIKTNITGATIGNVTHRLYNSTGSLIRQNNYTGIADASTNWTNLSTGYYYYNASLTINGAINASTETRNNTIYEVTIGLGYAKGYYLNVTSSATIAPAGAVTLANYTWYLLNSDYSVNQTMGTSATNTLSWYIFDKNLSQGQYAMRFHVNDSQGNDHFSYTGQFWLYDVNLTVIPRDAVSGDALTSFSIRSTHVNRSTTNGSMIINLPTGTFTYTLNSEGYQNITNTTTSFTAGAYTLTEYMQPTIRFILLREADNSAFVVNRTVSTALTIICDDSSQQYPFNGTNTVYTPVDCDWQYLKVDVDYGNSSYYRIKDPDYVGGQNITFYLLDLTLDTGVEQILTINDLTGDYSEGQVKIDRFSNGSTQNIISEPFDIANSVTMFLLKNALYTVSVINNDGEIRVMGTLIASAAGTKVLTLPSISFYPETSILGDKVLWNYTFENASFIMLQYKDLTNATNSLNYTVYNSTDGVVFSSYLTKVNGTNDVTFTYSPLQSNYSAFWSRLRINQSVLGAIEEIRYFNQEAPAVSEQSQSNVLPGIAQVVFWLALMFLIVLGLSFDVEYSKIGLVVVMIFADAFVAWHFLTFGPRTTIIMGVCTLVAIMNLISKSRVETGGD